MNLKVTILFLLKAPNPYLGKGQKSSKGDRYYEENSKSFEGYVKVLHLWDAETRMIEQWHRYCQRDMRDNFHMLDEKLIFANEVRDKKDYASKVLP